MTFNTNKKNLNLTATFSAAFLLTVSCNLPSEKTIPEGPVTPFDSDTVYYLRVYEDSSHNFYLNGHLIEFENLETRAAALINNQGLIYYANQKQSEKVPKDSKIFYLLKNSGIGVKTFRDSSFTQSYY